MLKFLHGLEGLSRQRPWLPKASGVAGLLIILWFIIARIAGKKAEKRFMTTTRLSLMDGEVRRACLHIEKHFAEPRLTPETLCAALITGEPFLEAIFQRELGMSIAGYIGQVRIHNAKRIVAKNPALDGLFLSVAHVGHGIMAAPSAGEILAARVLKLPFAEPAFADFGLDVPWVRYDENAL